MPVGRRLILLLVLATASGGCTGGTKGDDSGTAAVWVREEPVCATPELVLDPTDTGYLATTEHYTMTIEGFSDTESLDLATLAETSWGALASFFGTELPGPLDVRIAADEAGFQALLAADGISGVEAAGGYYDPGTGRAYLYRQPTAYYDRVLMLHEMVHQYQDQADGIGGLPFWYVEGLAEALSRHHWDGDCVELRVRPLLSWEDMAAQAADELVTDGGSPDLSTPLSGGEASRAYAQELVRLLASDPELAPRFSDWRAGVADGSVDAADLDTFEAQNLPVDELTDAFVAYVPVDQEPMSPVYLDWIPEGDDRALGFADASSAARVEETVSALSVSVAWPTTGYVGTVYGYDPATGDIELAFVDPDGAVSRFEVLAGAVTWDTYGSVARSGTVKWSQVADDASTTVSIGGASIALPRALPTAGGLALYGTSADFSGLTWSD